MVQRGIMGGVLAAVAGAAMLALSAAPASALTLSSPSLERPVAAADIEHVWWDRWGRWHPNYYGGGYWGPHYGYGWGRHCWRGYYGHLHCN